jgi:hypothetical protein
VGHRNEAIVKTPLEDAEEEAARAAADPNHITPMDGKGHVLPDGELPPNPRYTRQPKPNPDAESIAKAAKEVRQGPGYGEGPDGYKAPKNKGEKLRRNLPYKVRRFAIVEVHRL